ncbi:hypothetical protein MYIN104542_30285 [Mycobacterium intermedium]
MGGGGLTDVGVPAAPAVPGLYHAEVVNAGTAGTAGAADGVIRVGGVVDLHAAALAAATAAEEAAGAARSSGGCSVVPGSGGEREPAGPAGPAALTIASGPSVAGCGRCRRGGVEDACVAAMTTRPTRATGVVDPLRAVVADGVSGAIGDRVTTCATGPGVGGSGSAGAGGPTDGVSGTVVRPSAASAADAAVSDGGVAARSPGATDGLACGGGAVDVCVAAVPAVTGAEVVDARACRSAGPANGVIRVAGVVDCHAAALAAAPAAADASRAARSTTAGVEGSGSVHLYKPAGAAASAGEAVAALTAVA